MSSRIEIRLAGDWGEQLRRNLDKAHEVMKKAVSATAKETAKELRSAIFEDIQSSGDFGKPWKSSVKVESAIGDGEATITVRYSSSKLGQAAKLFETGGTVHGDPLLWIPLNDRQSLRKAIVRAGGAVYVHGRDGGHYLIGRKTRKVIAIGAEQINQHKRFHIQEAVRRVADRVPAIYRAKLAKLNK